MMLLLMLMRWWRWRVGVAGPLTPALHKILSPDLRRSHLRPAAAFRGPAGHHLTLLLSVLLLLTVLLSKWIRGWLLTLLSSLLLLILLLLLLHHVILAFLRTTDLLLLLLSAFVGASRLSEVGLRQMSLPQLTRRQQMCCVVALVLIW